MIKEVTYFLSNNFEMKDMGVVDIILITMLLIEYNGGATLLQFHYMEKVLSLFGYNDCKPASTPYDPNVLLKKIKE